ncbi:pseudouridylate synthase TRUB2, mitochondrial [Hylaeus volcanicus]|uniref:pseudouridylate synthase TRUB2, mitochondrial n=1 Tax=Hylaeus volcanicus TaxID=313075 RepID=UPI0023B78482|nr:pseudouridylate synthase TRUB2, mitochondrial [Hylaeus volcanicus]XP_053988897.1 pseudouridylate synthase TRUB2, mitochondrial [Hylaeus volcanicus]
MSFIKNTVQTYSNDARLLYKALDGIFLLYKSPSVVFGRMKGTVISNLCRDLNNMNVRPPTKYVSIEGATNTDMNVIVRDSYADNILVVGPRYQMNDFKLGSTVLSSTDLSGLVVCGINAGNKLIKKLRNANMTRCYKVKGLLGQATNNYFHTGKIIEKSTYAHVKRGHIDNICSSMQSSHQRKMFELCGVDIQSQAAYDLAVQGLLRPADSNIPMVYTIKCIDFSPPEFTLEIVCINEYDMYLKTIIHEVGLQLHSTATCTQIYCGREGLFTVESALLKKHWTLSNILNNIQMCRKIINENPHLINQDSPTLVDGSTDSPKVLIEGESTT